MSPSQSGYSDSELFRMQQEAERRVKDMQRRARNTLEAEPSFPPPQQAPSRPVPKTIPPAVSVTQKLPASTLQRERAEPARRSFPFNLLSSLNIGNDTLLILLVILLISGEEGNTKLLIALVYLLL